MEVVLAKAIEERPSKKPKTSPKNDSTAVKIPARWTESRTVYLLQTRYSEAGKKKFASISSKKQLTSFWLWLTSRFNVKAGVEFTSKQVSISVQSGLKTTNFYFCVGEE